MQDIVFYAAANETLGVVRDCTNMLRADAPVLTIGVAVCLKMRLFSAVEVATPYPLSAFTGVANWQWSMDSDFNRNTASKLVADENGISVHTVTDTVNGETRNFTEFVIPISNMNTQELSAWLGAEKTRSGLTGELVGYDSSENAAFVLQVENFTVRNRVAGLADPTALDLETVTRTQAELMIQSAVSSSAATKQDKLTSANAGTGISITSAGIISVSNVPQSAVAGLETSLAGKQNMLTAGYRTAIVNGSTVDQARYFAIEPAITAPTNQTTSVVLSAGRAYEIHAVAPNAKVLLNREEPVGGAHTFGLEGHAEIFVANTGYIQTGEHVVLSEPLKSNAVNNCTVRFHNNLAIISVEDHIAGYVVTVGTGSTSGTLPYALSSASQEYVAFDASLNGQTIDMGGAVTNGEKHVVGNGYADTILTGGVSCTSKTTFANLAMSGVVVSSGTLTLGDVYIPNGATVALSGGGLAIEKVSGDGGAIVYGLNRTIGSGMIIEGITITGALGNSTIDGGPIVCGYGSSTIRNCTFSGNSGYIASCISVRGYSGGTSDALISGCTFSGNTAIAGQRTNAALIVATSATFKNNSFDANSGIFIQGGSASIVFDGENKLRSFLVPIFAGNPGGSVTISSGAVVDLTGNTNATPIAPGGGIMIPPDASVDIIGSDGPAGSCGHFSALAIRGATITNTGCIYGATVTVPASSGTARGPWDLSTTEGMVQVDVPGATAREEVIPGGLYGIEEQ